MVADKPSQDAEAENRMTLGEHLEQLRRRILYALAGLVVGMAVGLMFGEKLVALIKHPYAQAMRDMDMPANLTVLNVTGGFTMYLKISLIAGILIASPWILYQLWMFVAAGLYPKERRYVLLAVPFSAAMFIAGAMFFLLALAQPALRVFLGFIQWMGLQPTITFDNHVGFMMTMMVVFGLGFQTPLVVFLLAKIGIVSLEQLHRYRRHAVVAILIVAAALTPPDPMSQLALAVPIWLLYELGVLLVWLFVRHE